MPITGFVSGCLARSVATPNVYTGPGNVVAGARGWWGLRAYTLASIGVSNVINLRASGDNATADFKTVPGGGLDLVGISSFLGTHGGSLFVTKLYDQTGNGNHLIQTTAANQPSLVLNGIGSLPIMSFVSASTQWLGTGAAWLMTAGQALTVNGFALLASSHGSFPILLTQTVVFLFGVNVDGSNAGFNAYWNANKSTNTTSPTTNTWLNVACTSDGLGLQPGIAVFINGSQQGGSAAGSNTITDNTGLMELANGAAGGNSDWDGSVNEIGWWDTQISSGNMNSMSSQAHAYWGV